MRIRVGIVAAVLPLLAACGTEVTPVASEPTESADVDSPSESDSVSPSESESATGSATGSATAPIYFVADAPAGERLFAEDHPVAGTTADDLLRAMTATPLDPDYRTILPADGSAGIVADDTGSGAILLELGAGSTWIERGDLTAAQANLAVQSIIYTIALNDPESSGSLYAFSDGDPVTLFGQDTSAGIEKADYLDVAALANLLTPAEGTEVSDGTLSVSGLSSSFEANVPWTITDEGGTEVDQGFFTAEGWLDALFPFEGDVDVSDLTPGEYTLTASTDDPSDGEGLPPTEDTRTFTIQ